MIRTPTMELTLTLQQLNLSQKSSQTRCTLMSHTSSMPTLRLLTGTMETLAVDTRQSRVSREALSILGPSHLRLVVKTIMCSTQIPLYAASTLLRRLETWWVVPSHSRSQQSFLKDRARPTFSLLLDQIKLMEWLVLGHGVSPTPMKLSCLPARRHLLQIILLILVHTRVLLV